MSVRHWSVELTGLPLTLLPKQNEAAVAGITQTLERKFGPVVSVTVGYVWLSSTGASGAESREAKRALEEERLLLPIKAAPAERARELQRIETELLRLDAESQCVGCSGHAFVTFEDESAAVAARNETELVPCEIDGFRPFVMTVGAAPHPTDVLWDNLRFSWSEQVPRLSSPLLSVRCNGEKPDPSCFTSPQAFRYIGLCPVAL
jgi:hypothetical protein